MSSALLSGAKSRGRDGGQVQAKWRTWLREPLLADDSPRASRGPRIVLLLLWLAVAGWLAWNHVPWRDEARAWSLMMMGRDWPDLFRAVHGEGHPYLWYVILRAGWDLFGVRQVLPVAGFLIGTAAAALLIWRGPFRLLALTLMVFSAWLGFEYVAIARNYGMSALLMFVIAALWPRIRDRFWLGVLLLLLCNTNVPSVFLAGALLLYRFLELWSEQSPRRGGAWARFVGNALLALAGVILCFLAVYPPVNSAAASTQAQPLTALNLLLALISSQRSFITVGFGDLALSAQIFLFGSLLIFARRPPAFAAALAGLVGIKLFYFFVYPGYYRHSALFFAFMVALVWIEADKRRRAHSQTPAPAPSETAGSWLFLILLGAQSLTFLLQPVYATLHGIPYSNSARLSAILDRPEYRRSLLMIDPDTYGEAVAYQTGRPYWLIRQDRPGTLTPLVTLHQPPVTLTGILARAETLRRHTGAPVIIALRLPIDRIDSGSFAMIYDTDRTVLTPASVADFKARTRKLATFDTAQSDERFSVYVYPR